MKIESIVLENEQIYQLLSKTESCNYCVFISPNSIIEAEKFIDNYKLDCSTDDLYSEKLIIEFYEKREEAMDRVVHFSWMNQFYVCCYKNGKFVTKNQ